MTGRRLGIGSVGPVLRKDTGVIAPWHPLGLVGIARRGIDRMPGTARVRVEKRGVVFESAGIDCDVADPRWRNVDQRAVIGREVRGPPGDQSKPPSIRFRERASQTGGRSRIVIDKVLGVIALADAQNVVGQCKRRDAAPFGCDESGPIGDQKPRLIDEAVDLQRLPAVGVVQLRIAGAERKHRQIDRSVGESGVVVRLVGAIGHAARDVAFPDAAAEAGG